jgi:hypothetical protein
VWDSKIRAHMADDIKDELRRLQLVEAVIPGGCGTYMLPPQMGWKGAFKIRFEQLLDEWKKTAGS